MFAKIYYYKPGPRQHAILGHYRPTSETQFKWRFAGGPLVVVFYMLTGVLLADAVW